MNDKLMQFAGLTRDTASDFGTNVEEEKKAVKKDKVDDVDKTESVLDSLGLGKNKLGRKKTTMTVSMDTYNKLITLSVTSGETISDIIENILDKRLKDVKINEEYVEAFNNNEGKRRNRVKATRENIANK